MVFREPSFKNPCVLSMKQYDMESHNCLNLSGERNVRLIRTLKRHFDQGSQIIQNHAPSERVVSGT